MNLKTILIAFVFLCAGSVWAQMTPPTPGSDVKKLDYFAGTWTVEGTIAQGPWGMGGKFSSTRKTSWMTGSFFLEGRSDFKMPAELGGDGEAVYYMGYDTEKNVYTNSEFNSQGRREVSIGTLNGDTWTWNSAQNYFGQDVKKKMTVKVLSSTSYSVKLEVSTDGTDWMPFMEAKATKK